MVYCLPACLFLAIFALRLAASVNKQTATHLAFVICFAACALCPVLIRPIVPGYADVVGVLVMAILPNYCRGWDERGL